ncbi:MAG: phytanoyl-CoA dioxygenase family protein [Chloroflexia bacterium]|nr:phytanoyl-CoA dioxygenase family protein [Chloroflexia bacterium]
MRNTQQQRATNGAIGVVGVSETVTAPTRQQRSEHLTTDFSEKRDRYSVSVQEYRSFIANGYLVVRGLVSVAEIAELQVHVEDLLHGRVTVPGLEPPAPDTSVEEIERRYLRIHMLHRQLEIHERFLLHPRILDVLEALIGPDVMAMQSMLFIKAPGGEGQGYHQDSYYIPTYPDTLCGAWVAVDNADEENGCLWITPGSHVEPIYPTEDRVHQNHANLGDLAVVENVSHTDSDVNTLSRVAAQYDGREVSVPVQAGDVIFFGGHVLHRSHQNRSANRFRRAFVGHYANARAFTMWGSQGTPQPSNHQHILARGSTHLPFGEPRFGTPCAATEPPSQGAAGALMTLMAEGEDMGVAPQDPHRNDPMMMTEHEADAKRAE